MKRPQEFIKKNPWKFYAYNNAVWFLMYNGFCMDLSKFQWKFGKWLETWDFFSFFCFTLPFLLHSWLNTNPNWILSQNNISHKNSKNNCIMTELLQLISHARQNSTVDLLKWRIRQLNCVIICLKGNFRFATEFAVYIFCHKI